MEQGGARREGSASRPRCYTELNAAPCSLIHNGQVIKLASHVWRECQYRHIKDKEQDQDLSGVLCTAWVIASDLATPPSPAAAAPSKLAIQRLWLVNQHTCCVFSSAAVPMEDKMGVVHAWGPREQGSEPGASLSSHPPAGSGQQQGAEPPSDSAQKSASGTQYRGLREGPCWELCSVCDVMAQLVDASSGQDLGLLKCEDKVVSAEVVFRWLDLVKVLLSLLLLALHVLATRPYQVLLSYTAHSSMHIRACNAKLCILLCAAHHTAVNWLAARARPFTRAREQVPLDAWSTNPAPPAAASVPLSSASASTAASQRSVPQSFGVDQEAGTDAVFAARPDAACASAPMSVGQQQPAASGAEEHSSTDRAAPHPDAPPAAAAAAAEPPGVGADVVPDLTIPAPPSAASVQVPEWSGHVFACRGSMQSAVFCIAFATGLFAALLATGVAKVLADLYDALA